jgi:5-amino-6-(5-phospho-D-ribitylamino)uracil phosphatase
MTRLYVSDADFTLLRSNSYISEFSRNSINKLIEKGINFTIATARSIVSLKPKVGDIKLKLPLIEFNGGYITNYHNEQPIKMFTLQKNIVNQIISIANDRDMKPMISTFNSKQNIYPPNVVSTGMEWYIEDRIAVKDKRLRPQTNYSDAFNHEILTLTFIDREKPIKNLYNSMTSNIIDNTSFHLYENKYTPGWYWLTFHDKLSTKENALQELIKINNLKDHEVIVFGDDVNDIGMMKLATHSIAVENAVEKVKEVADEIIGPNDKDAVIRYILKKEGFL